MFGRIVLYRFTPVHAVKINEYRAFLVDFHGVKQKQIESILGISQSFVSRTLRKARIKIIEELNDRGYAV